MGHVTHKSVSCQSCECDFGHYGSPEHTRQMDESFHVNKGVVSRSCVAQELCRTLCVGVVWHTQTGACVMLHMQMSRVTEIRHVTHKSGSCQSSE